ncbi:MAG: hypothetical protein QW452_02430 [Pyrobaculum sp.]
MGDFSRRLVSWRSWVVLGMIKEPLMIHKRMAMISSHVVMTYCAVLRDLDSTALVPVNPCHISKYCSLNNCAAIILVKIQPGERIHIITCNELCNVEVLKPVIIMIRHETRFARSPS